MSICFATIMLCAMIVIGHRTALAQSLDHTPLDALLRAHVSNGVVDYRGFQDNPAFARYIEALAKAAALDGKAAELAYYINAYNAFAIEGILEGLSPSSLLGRARYFKYTDRPLNGRRISLHDIEHAILRTLGDPRMHFAIVCASKSCPFLRAEAYAASRLDAQLDDQAWQFVNDPFRNRFDKGAQTAYLSETFKWFDEDFRAAAGSSQRFVARYVADAEVAQALRADGYKIAWIDYDWRLNGTPPWPPRAISVQ
jgi:hypothetical protein